MIIDSKINGCKPKIEQFILQNNTESGSPNYGIVFYNGANNNFVNNSNFILGDYLLTNEPLVEIAGSSGNIGSNNIFNDVIVNYP